MVVVEKKIWLRKSRRREHGDANSKKLPRVSDLHTKNSPDNGKSWLELAGGRCVISDSFDKYCYGGLSCLKLNTIIREKEPAPGKKFRLPTGPKWPGNESTRSLLRKSHDSPDQ